MVKVSKKDFLSYEKVRQSGDTNMFDVPRVSRLSGLNNEQIFEVMKNYSKYKKAFMKEDEE